MKGFRMFLFAMTAAVSFISGVLITVTWLRVSEVVPSAWFVPHLILTDASPGALISKARP